MLKKVEIIEIDEYVYLVREGVDSLGGNIKGCIFYSIDSAIQEVKDRMKKDKWWE